MSKIRYPKDTTKTSKDDLDIIDPMDFPNLSVVFKERVARSSAKIAYQQFDERKNEWTGYSWQEVADRADKVSAALSSESLSRGARITIQMSNSVDWVVFDQSSLKLSLVVVPVYVEDRSENVAYIIEDTQSELLVVESLSQWNELESQLDKLHALKRVVVVADSGLDETSSASLDPRVLFMEDWLGQSIDRLIDRSEDISPDQLATIVYTSGTTGKPKGVMLSHENMLWNAYAGLQSIAVFPEDKFLSFLPLSHMFERTVGYYLTVLSGSEVAFNRSIKLLSEDMQLINPTILISVPRVFERVYGRIKANLESSSKFKRWLFEFTISVGWKRFESAQGRSVPSVMSLLWPILDLVVANRVKKGFGGNLRLAICGGAKLGSNLSRAFVGLGIDILQGYGLTESSPVLTVNTLENNKPVSIGLPYRGVEVRLGDLDELQVRSRFTMLGYWNNEIATSQIIDSDGWLSTGDIASIDDSGFIHITGRIKEIIVLGNGEKVPPADMESAISDDPLFEQVMVVGEGRPYLTALVVLNRHAWGDLKNKSPFNNATTADLHSRAVCDYLQNRMSLLLTEFPGYAFIKKVHPMLEPWTIESGLITPTLKVKRPLVLLRFAEIVDAMYE